MQGATAAKKKGGGKCSWTNLFHCRQRWSHHSRNNKLKKKKNPSSSGKSWRRLGTRKNVLTATGIYLAGDARVCLRCHRIDVHALVLQVTDCIILLYLPIKSQRLALIFKVCCSQVNLIIPTDTLKGLPLWQTSFLSLRLWVRFCTLRWYTCCQTPYMKKQLLL